jgi:hypothetical protein
VGEVEGVGMGVSEDELAGVLVTNLTSTHSVGVGVVSTGVIGKEVGIGIGIDGRVRWQGPRRGCRGQNRGQNRGRARRCVGVEVRGRAR